MSTRAAQRAGGAATARTTVSCSCIYCGSHLWRPVNRAAHASCAECRRRNRRKSNADPLEAELSRQRRLAVVSDPSGDFARGALIPFQQVKATAKIGNWPAGITFTDGRKTWIIVGAAGTVQGLEQVTAADERKRARDGAVGRSRSRQRRC